MRFSLIPREMRFFDMFDEAAAKLTLGSCKFLEMVTTFDKLDIRSHELKREEDTCDVIIEKIIKALDRSFITPFDREDIYGLASNLDDCMDLMEAAADLIVLYRIGDLPDGISAQVEVLARMSELTAEAMPRLRSMRDLSEYWIEINRLENQADQIYRRLLAELFNNGADAITVLKLKEVIDELEAAADAFETVANTVESIAVKES